MNVSNENAYYGLARREILPFLPPVCGRVLEVGCGTGETLRLLRDQGRASWIGGVDLFQDNAKTAAHTLDSFQQLNLDQERIDLPDRSVDVVMCLDVLEHLTDPWRALKNIRKLLKPEGLVVASIPNVRNFRVLMPLLLQGQWQYTESGLLDRTHLRFFTQESAVQLIESAGFEIVEVGSTGLGPGSKAGLADKMTFGLFRRLLELQIVVVGRSRSALPA